MLPASIAFILLTSQEVSLEQLLEVQEQGRRKDVALAPGATFSEGEVMLMASVTFDLPFTAEFEIKPASVPFDGKNLRQSSGSAERKTASHRVFGLKAGQYHWRVRISAGKEQLPWKAFPADPAFVFTPPPPPPIIFQPLGVATRDQLMAASKIIESRLKEMSFNSLEVAITPPAADGSLRLHITVKNGQEFNMRDNKVYIEELLSHKGSVTWCVERQLTIAESYKYGLLKGEPPGCAWVLSHEAGHLNTYEESSLRAPELVQLTPEIATPQDIAFASTPNGLTWKPGKSAIDKVKKLPPDVNLVVLLDGVAFTRVDTKTFVSAATDKRDMWFMGDRREGQVFLIASKYPLPFGFLTEDVYRKREKLAESLFVSMRASPNPRSVSALVHVLQDTEFARNFQDRIEAMRKALAAK